MHFFLTVLIFIVILFFYIHIIAQYKKSEDLEIYEMDYSTNKQLQEVCDVKQPVLFQFSIPNLENFTIDRLLEKNSSLDMKVKDVNDYWANPSPSSVDSVGLSLRSLHGLIKTDTSSHYFTENNEDYIEESGLYKELTEVNDFLKPSFSLQTKYDVSTGSKFCVTPLRYHTEYRRFFIVTQGKIRVKMTPWRSKKHLYPIVDYENYEFWSPINVFNPQPRYLSDMDKLKFLEFDVPAGYVLYVPPYWWYSIKYMETDTLVISATYNSTMNILANIPDIIRYYLQQHNTHNKIAKRLIEIKEREQDKELEEPDKELEEPDISTNEANITEKEIQQNIEQLVMEKG